MAEGLGSHLGGKVYHVRQDFESHAYMIKINQFPDIELTI